MDLFPLCATVIKIIKKKALGLCCGRKKSAYSKLGLILLLYFPKSVSAFRNRSP